MDLKVQTKRLMSYSVVEGLLKGLRIQDNSPEMEEIARICGYVRKLPPKELAVEKFVELLEWLALHYYSNLARSDALFEVGARLFEGYRTTILGRVQLAAINIMGPDRLTKRFVEFADKNSNFGERTVEEVGLHSYIIHYRGVPLPGDYLLGLMKSGLVAAGVANPSLSWSQVGPEDTDFKVSW